MGVEVAPTQWQEDMSWLTVISMQREQPIAVVEVVCVIALAYFFGTVIFALS
jgi:hypothetical protein